MKYQVGDRVRYRGKEYIVTTTDTTDLPYLVSGPDGLYWVQESELQPLSTDGWDNLVAGETVIEGPDKYKYHVIEIGSNSIAITTRGNILAWMTIEQLKKEGWTIVSPEKEKLGIVCICGNDGTCHTPHKEELKEAYLRGVADFKKAVLEEADKEVLLSKVAWIVDALDRAEEKIKENY